MVLDNPQILLSLLTVMFFLAVIFRVISHLKGEIEERDAVIEKLSGQQKQLGQGGQREAQGQDGQQGGGKKREIVLYYTDSCPHCINFKPVWKSFVSKNMSLPVKFREVDCEKEEADVDGVPTVMYYENGKEEEYRGTRTRKGLEEFIRSKLKKN